MVASLWSLLDMVLPATDTLRITFFGMLFAISAVLMGCDCSYDLQGYKCTVDGASGSCCGSFQNYVSAVISKRTVLEINSRLVNIEDECQASESAMVATCKRELGDGYCPDDFDFDGRWAVKPRRELSVKVELEHHKFEQQRELLSCPEGMCLGVSDLCYCSGLSWCQPTSAVVMWGCGSCVFFLIGAFAIPCQVSQNFRLKENGNHPGWGRDSGLCWCGGFMPLVFGAVAFAWLTNLQTNMFCSEADCSNFAEVPIPGGGVPNWQWRFAGLPYYCASFESEWKGKSELESCAQDCSDPKCWEDLSETWLLIVRKNDTIYEINELADPENRLGVLIKSLWQVAIAIFLCSLVLTVSCTLTVVNFPIDVAPQPGPFERQRNRKVKPEPSQGLTSNYQPKVAFAERSSR